MSDNDSDNATVVADMANNPIQEIIMSKVVVSSFTNIAIFAVAVAIAMIPAVLTAYEFVA